MSYERKQHPWYNFAGIMSMNAYLNMVCGGRGLGKTYGAKKIVIRKAIRSFEAGEPIEQFVYLRRYKPEIVASSPTFFADIEMEFPGYDFKTHGKAALMAPASTRFDKKRDWYTIGYFVALSTAQSMKGVSYHAVRTIIFDEFIIEKSNMQYLPNEATVFLNFYSTVDRAQDKTRVFMLANAVSINNPYFMKWGIEPDKNTDEFKRYSKRRDGGYYVVAHFPEAADFAQSVYATDFGAFIQGTEYAEYAVGNMFADNNDTMIELKDPDARYVYSLKTKDGNFAVWLNSKTDMCYMLARQPKVPRMFTTVPEFVDDDILFLTNSDRVLQELRGRWRKAMVKYDKPSTRNSMLPIFDR